jgi:hypothetical protein
MISGLQAIIISPRTIFHNLFSSLIFRNQCKGQNEIKPIRVIDIDLKKKDHINIKDTNYCPQVLGI